MQVSKRCDGSMDGAHVNGLHARAALTVPRREEREERRPPACLVTALLAEEPAAKGMRRGFAGSERFPLSTTDVPSLAMGTSIVAFCWIKDSNTRRSRSTAAQNFCCSRLSA